MYRGIQQHRCVSWHATVVYDEIFISCGETDVRKLQYHLDTILPACHVQHSTCLPCVSNLNLRLLHSDDNGPQLVCGIQITSDQKLSV